jgi:hypothetical protein
MLEFKPDSPTERQRKRRSSRTGGLGSKDPWANTLLFRTIQDEQYNIYDWQAAIKPRLIPDSQESLLEDIHSPMSPSFTSFTNPFASRESRTPASSIRPDFQRGTSNQSTNSYPHAQRERPDAMISPSPSLRSRRSDLSSQASSQHPPMGFTSAHIQNYTTVLPTDLPSPASTSGYDSQFIEGWTSAQGRSSALSSHTRGSNSIASAVNSPAPIGSTPPGPRETILDRAFQMKYIPGSERIEEQEDGKISSIARFEALMREADEQKRQKFTTSTHDAGNTSGWDLDEESDDSFGDEAEEDEDDADGLEMSDQEVPIPTPAQRALDYISGRVTPLPASRPLSPAPRSPPIPFLNQQAISAFHGYSSGGGLRPRTGTNSSSHRNSRPNSLALPSRSISATTIPSLKDSNLAAPDRDPKEKRSSSTSVKRLSFQEFAKRLSSTSSLLLVQTNASSSSGRDGSRRGSSEYGDEEKMARSSLSMRGGEWEKERGDKRCGWRGSVGVFGGEGGFL